eukprot:scaffold40146_cov40-Attheya_sp.AAC.2
MSIFVGRQALDDFPSMVYAANVNGDPTNPIKDVSACSASLASVPKISRIKGRSSSKLTVAGSDRAATSASVRISVEMTGPVPLMTSNSMPSVGRGVKMSENMMIPSIP